VRRESNRQGVSAFLANNWQENNNAEVKTRKHSDQPQKFIILRRNSLAEFLPISQE